MIAMLARVGAVLGIVWLTLVAWPDSAAAQPQDRCAACHLEIGDDRLATPAKQFPEDIHKAKGFGCVACHGGDAGEEGMEAMDRKKGFIGKPARQQIPQLCGRCHSDAQFMKQYNPALRVDQVAEYSTSVHGRRLAQFNDPKVAVCVSCHPAHSIRPPSDPKSTVHPLRVADTCGGCHGNAKYMEEYKIPTDQLAKYKTSVHWNAMSVKGDLSAPTCNKCHGNHGASPPGVKWVGNVCGQCHTVMADYFRTSVHAKAFADMGTPGCATCHENHGIQKPSDAMLGLGDKAVCSTCHSADDKGGQSAAQMRELIDSLSAQSQKAAAVLRRAEEAGMEVSQAEFDLNGAREALVKARAAVHAFSVDAVKKETDPGLSIGEKAYTRGLHALEDMRFRRAGLGVSLVIILAVIAGLVMKIRQLESRRSAPGPGTPGGAA